MLYIMLISKTWLSTLCQSTEDKFFFLVSRIKVIRSFVVRRSFVRSFVCLFVRPFVRSSVCSFVRTFIHSFVRFFVLLFVCSFVHARIWRYVVYLEFIFRYDILKVCSLALQYQRFRHLKMNNFFYYKHEDILILVQRLSIHCFIVKYP